MSEKINQYLQKNLFNSIRTESFFSINRLQNEKQTWKDRLAILGKVSSSHLLN